MKENPEGGQKVAMFQFRKKVQIAEFQEVTWGCSRVLRRENFEQVDFKNPVGNCVMSFFLQIQSILRIIQVIVHGKMVKPIYVRYDHRHIYGKMIKIALL